MSGTHALKRKPEGRLDNLLLVLLKNQKIWIHAEDSFKHVTQILSPSQQKPEIQIYPGKICVGPSCLMNWIPMTYMNDLPGIWKWYVSSNTTSALDWKGQRRHKMKESCWTPKFLQTVNKQADKICSVETPATLQGKERMTLRAESWAWRVEL